MNENDVAIKQCDEVRVYVSDADYLCIAQINHLEGEEYVIAVHVEFARRLVSAIKAATTGAKAA